MEQTNLNPIPALPGMPPSTHEPLVYHCVCGREFEIDLQVGGVCPDCRRVIKSEAIQMAMAATVTVGDLSKSTAFQLHDSLADDPFVGKVLGHFKLDRQLGRGGMGAVYRALDTSLQRYVAVKVVHSNSGGSTTRGQISGMLQEAIAQARLNHPNVVTIYYVGQHENDPFLAMELVAGPTVADRAKQGAIPFAQAMSIASQIVDALQHAAQFGIIHADIKPNNLLIASDNQIKLSDFGLSRMMSGEEGAGAVAGTPAYLAPELVDGKPMSMQSDMYALGVTLFEIVFGRLPFKLRGNSVRERIESHRDAVIDYPQPWPVDVPKEFAHLLNRLMAKKPEDRFESYDELQAELAKLTPTSKTFAGFAPRAMAYAIDQVLVLTAIAPFFAALIVFSFFEELEDYRWVAPFIGLFSFSVPITYLLLIRRGWRSLGRFLFQLQIVDQHGLPMRNDMQMAREMLRSMFALITPIAFYLGQFWSMLDHIIDLSLFMFIGLDIVFFFVTRNRMTLHDIICKSHVVLDVRGHNLR
jgi:eukaryotic-like serine/threonine-protein kinase